MLEDLQIRHYSPTTIRLYLYAIKAFAKHFGKPPDQLGAEHIRRYQLFLTKEKKVSTSTYGMMICGLRFFYTHTLHRKVAIERIPFPRRERKLPVILSRDEVKALLEAPSDLRDRAMLAILYGSGLRVSEVTRLKVADIDSARNVLWVRFGKGRKDRQAFKELVWTLTVGGKTDRAYGTLKPDYVLDDIVIMGNTGAGGALSITPDMVGNQAPVLKVEGAKARSVKVGEPVTLIAVATDDGKPKPRG